jgi:ribosome-associated protein
MATRKPEDHRTIGSADLLQRVIELCHERKGEDVVDLDVRELVEYMDNLVIVTGRSARQNRAIGEHVMTQLKREARVLPLSSAGLDAGTWVCVDFVDVILHVFEAEARAHYDLELLWGDAGRTEHEAPASTLALDAADADEALALDAADADEAPTLDAVDADEAVVDAVVDDSELQA